MNGNPRRALLLSPDAGVREAAATAGLDTWSVTSPAAVTVAGRHTGRRVTVDLGDADALHRALVDTARAHGIGHIVYLGDTEALHLAVERALRELSPGRAEPLRRLRDPVTVRRILNQGGVSVVRAEPAATVADVRALVARSPLPVAVRTAHAPKPTVIRSGADLETWAAGAPAGPHLVEQFPTGPRISVDTLTRDGMHEVTGMTTRLAGGAGLLRPAPLPEADRAGVRGTVRALLDLAGLQSGPAHTQVVLTGDGPRITAAKARLGAPAIRRLARASTGRAPEHDVLSALAGAPRPPAWSTPPGRPAALARLAPHHGGRGQAANLDALARLGHVDDVRVVPAAAGAPAHVEVIVHGSTPEEAEERLDAVRRGWADPARWGPDTPDERTGTRRDRDGMRPADAEDLTTSDRPQVPDHT
ncbi:hypothetical protein OIB37_19815 [Streptomyces sp. NBC_00820]|uniref:ATP-grasp domain-containing protein n=1 Tax=Streptomyces sp. NBC_00820 TaxID=2975842 RepID=UPI002ED5343A|nr:hypothetical protein OIB37_19815 [Streptomyces sp. NBC_00820]